MTFSTEDIVYTHYNDRDVETPALLQAVEEAMPLDSLVDVGAHHSCATYAPRLREILRDAFYGAVDPYYCEETAKIADMFFRGNVLAIDASSGYDFVACVSSIEHSGITTYKVEDYLLERRQVFAKLVCLTRKRLFISCPFGLPALYEGQYANVTDEDLDEWEGVTTRVRMKSEARFFYTKFAQGKEPWVEISREEARVVPMDKALGIQCVMIFQARR